MNFFSRSYQPPLRLINRLCIRTTKPNNNILERLNGTFRERTKVVRSFDNGIGAEEFAAGMQTYYNYIRPHQGIGGMTPAQLANIPINLVGNRWETMIGLAATK